MNEIMSKFSELNTSVPLSRQRSETKSHGEDFLCFPRAGISPADVERGRADSSHGVSCKVKPASNLWAFLKAVKEIAGLSWGCALAIATKSVKDHDMMLHLEMVLLRYLLLEIFDFRNKELDGLIAGSTDEVIVVGILVIAFKARNSIGQDHLACNATVFEEFHGPKDGAEPDAGILLASHLIKIVHTQMGAMFQKLIQNDIALM
jgi:hypothetical protein